MKRASAVAQASTADSAHIPPVSNSNTKHKHIRLGRRLHKLFQNYSEIIVTRIGHPPNKWIVNFLNTPVCTFFSIGSLPLRTQSAAVDSVTLKINRVNHPLSLPHPLLIQQHNDYYYYTDRRRIEQPFSPRTECELFGHWKQHNLPPSRLLTNARTSFFHRDSFATSKVSRAAGSCLSDCRTSTTLAWLYTVGSFA